MRHRRTAAARASSASHQPTVSGATSRPRGRMLHVTMRLYVLCFSDYTDIAPHVIAEVVRESAGEEPAMSIASALAGERALIVTRAQLLTEPMGRAALEAWEDRNDSEYRRESEAILAEDGN